MNEITIFEANKLDKIAKTGNERLDRISGQIMTEMNKVNALFTEVKAKTEAYARACAPLFGEIKRDKLYEKGGFKSLEEYAEQFGVQKSTAYAWARVGEAFFLEDNEYTRKIRATLTMSNMAELTKADRVQLAAAIDSKEITGETAQKDIREFANTHRKDGKGKERVLPTFTVTEYRSDGKGAVIAENVTREDMYGAVAESISLNWGSSEAIMFTPAKFDGDKPSAAQHFVAYTKAGFCVLYEYRPYTKSVSKRTVKDKKFDLAAYIAGLTPDERKALAAMAAGENVEA